MSWKRADGRHGSKTCEHSVTGVIVVGPGRGEAFKVCTEKEKCAKHWSAWQKERKQRAVQREKGGAKESAKAREDRHKREQEARERAEKRCTAALPAIFTALAEKVKRAPATMKGPLASVLIRGSRGDDMAAKYLSLSAGSTAEDLVRYCAFAELTDHVDTWNGLTELGRRLKPFGIDVKKIVDQVAPAKAEEKAPAAGKRKKK